MLPFCRVSNICAVLVGLSAVTIAGASSAQDAGIEEDGLFKVTVEPQSSNTAEPAPSRFVECDFSNVAPADEVMRTIRHLAKSENFPDDMPLAIAKQVSGYRMDVVSAEGAVGIMQLMPKIAQRFHVDRCDAAGNIRGAIRYLRLLQEKYDNPLFVLAAYFAGEDAVDARQGLPPDAEVLRDVTAIMSDLYGWRAFGARPATPPAATAPDRPDVAKSGSEEWSQGFVFHVEGKN